MAGQHRKRRRPRPPPGLRDHHDDGGRDARFRRLRPQPLHRDLRLLLRRRRGPDDRRVRPLGLPRRRLLGRGGAQLDRRHRDRRLADRADRASASTRSNSTTTAKGCCPRSSARSWRSSSSRSASSRGGACTGSSASSSRRSRSTGHVGSPSRTRPGPTTATGSKRPKKQAKAERRFHPGRRTDRFKEAFRDIVGGKPSVGVAKVAEQAVAATREAGEEVRAAGERVVHPKDDDQD